jgi:hypothetical protein
MKPVLLTDRMTFSSRYILIVIGFLIVVAFLFTPIFVADAETILIQKSGNGIGTITVNDQSCGPDCLGLTMRYLREQTYVVKAAPAQGSFFAGWQFLSGDSRKGDEFPINPGETISAVFQQIAPGQQLTLAALGRSDQTHHVRSRRSGSRNIHAGDDNLPRDL